MSNAMETPTRRVWTKHTDIIDGVDNVVADDMLSRLPSANNDERIPSTSQGSRHVKDLFTI